ncbi:MAG TPA: choice-of-anchor D domain-containing protein [Terriglobia bacterium]|nr:choice-of-anchor D domain-containing protein [Terriglobia bacterium]
MDLIRTVPQEQPGVAARGGGGETHLAPEALPKSVRDAILGRRLRMNSRDEAQVYILMTAVTDVYLRQLRDEGATIELTDPGHRRIQARIPASLLQSIADLPFVNFIRLPSYAVRRTGSVDTEGDAILLADQVRQQLKVDGTGVRVGVISDGLKGVFATGCTTCGGAPGGPISTQDLPNTTGTRNSAGVLTSSSGGIIGQSFQSNSDLEGLPPPGCGFPGAGAEGTALLEVIHDISPGAQLSFANADTDIAFEKAVNSLASKNDVAMDDLGFFGLASDGTSSVSINTANALNNAANAIRAYFTAVGNSANEHTYGLFTDSGVDGTTINGISNSGHLDLFQQTADTTDVLGLGPKPYNVIKLPTNGEVVIFLTWDDAFGASTNNYDLYLVQESTGKVVARSTNPQTGTQDPEEDIDFVNTGSEDNFQIVIQNVGNLAQAKHLNLFSFQPECAAAGPAQLTASSLDLHNYNTSSRSITAENDAGGSPVSVVSVGAICSASMLASTAFPGNPSCTDSSHSTLEFYSSQGPTLDGRTKPEISGIDGVSVTGAGHFENPFFGTSAATPHIAGIAALLLEAAPCLVNGASSARDAVTARTNLRNLILDNAVPLGSPVPNDVFGFGRADALASAEKTLPVFNGPSTLTVSGSAPTGVSVTAAQIGFVDPNSCPLTTLNWTGGCGAAPASSINCPFGTSNLSVAASNNALAFSAPANIQVVVTSFSVGASPGSATVGAGQPATYTVTVTAKGGPFSSSVTLGCSSLPAESTCSFNPATVTPGSTSAQSTLTVSTMARSLAPLANLRPLNRAQRWTPIANLLPTPPPFAIWLAVATLVALSLIAVRSPRTRWRRHAAMAGASAMLVLLVIQIGCGSGSGGSSTPPAPSASLSPGSLSFATQALKTTSAAQSVTLTNSGSAGLNVTGISTSGDFAQTDNCGASLGAGANCAIKVTFTPTQSGARTGTLSVNDNATGSPQTVSLTGTGQAGTPAGTYSIGISGTSGTLVNTSTATLVVQ